MNQHELISLPNFNTYHIEKNFNRRILNNLKIVSTTEKNKVSANYFRIQFSVTFVI